MRSFRSGAAYGVFMQAVEARRVARRERVSRDRGNPLDTLNDFIAMFREMSPFVIKCQPDNYWLILTQKNYHESSYFKKMLIKKL